MAPACQNTLTLNHYIIYYGRICFLYLDNAVSLLPKKPFPPFLDNKKKVAIKIVSHQDIQHRALKSWDQDVFFALVWGIFFIMMLEFLQGCGNQIGVNTWTG